MILPRSAKCCCWNALECVTPLAGKHPAVDGCHCFVSCPMNSLICKSRSEPALVYLSQADHPLKRRCRKASRREASKLCCRIPLQGLNLSRPASSFLPIHCAHLVGRPHLEEVIFRSAASLNHETNPILPTTPSGFSSRRNTCHKVLVKLWATFNPVVESRISGKICPTKFLASKPKLWAFPLHAQTNRTVDLLELPVTASWLKTLDMLKWIDCWHGIFTKLSHFTGKGSVTGCLQDEAWSFSPSSCQNGSRHTKLPQAAVQARICQNPAMPLRNESKTWLLSNAAEFFEIVCNFELSLPSSWKCLSSVKKSTACSFALQHGLYLRER